MKLSKAIARRLKGLRETSGLSQQEVAVRAELSLSLVAKLEQGKKADPRASTLLALAEALGVRPGALLEDLFLVALPLSAVGPRPGDEEPKPGRTAGPGVVPEDGAESAPAEGAGVAEGQPGKNGKGKGKAKAKGKAKGKAKAKKAGAQKG